MFAAEIIKKKRNGEQLSATEIKEFILGYTLGHIPDYQMSALLMAIYFKGMTDSETLELTKTMLHSGTSVDTSIINGFKADKHSTGGVGDKTSLILGPIVAACGVSVPMISGRGLGHTGGTLDKLESISGFDTQIAIDKFVAITKEIGLCFIGQTKEICPADKKIYALRDVTATVESLPLICASIMSKKLAEGIDGLVLDVKFGSGAFMKTADQAKALAEALMNIGKGYGKKVTALLTSMNQPLGRFAGNGWEVFECVEILENKKYLGTDGNDMYADTRELSLQLSAEMIYQSGKYLTLEDSYNAAKHALESGEAWKKFQLMCLAQSGDFKKIHLSHEKLTIRSRVSGFLTEFNVEKIGIAAIQLKAGRKKVDDILDLSSGIEFHKKLGDFAEMGAPLFTIYCDRIEDSAVAAEILSMCYSMEETPPLQKHQLIKERLT
jgi:pyrimidine-nucleoside phosphorylase